MSDIVVVDDGRTYVSTETAEVATEAAARAKQWAQESERQANIATSNADTAVQAKDDAVAAKNYAEAAITDTNLVTVATDLQATPSNIKTVSTNISNVNSVASNISNVNAVAGNATNINAVNANKTNIDKVAGDINRVKLVADDIASVHTVAVDISNIIDVADNKTNIDTVASNILDVNAVGGNITKVNAVADNETNINAVNANKTNIDTVANNISDVSTVGGDIARIINVADDLTNIDAVAGNATNINAVNSNRTNINKVANNITDVNKVATDISSVNTVATDILDVKAVEANKTNINTVASNISDVNAVSSNISNVNTVASDSTAINTAVNNLPAINAAPTHAQHSQIWAEGLDSEVTPLGGTHSSKVWAQIAEQAASGVQNPANRNLSNLTDTGQMIIDSANGTISNCILEIPQNIKLELSNNVLTLKAGSVLTLTGSTYATATTTQDKTISYSYFTEGDNYMIFASSTGALQGLINVSYVFSGDTQPVGVPTNSVFFNTNDKLIYIYQNNQWNLWGVCYPICILRASGGVLSFVKDSNGRDMIFNGWCYIGGSNGTQVSMIVFPGIKYFLSNGYTNGKLNNQEYTTRAVIIASRTSGLTNANLCLEQNGLSALLNYNYREVDELPATASTGMVCYNRKTNLFYRYVTDHWQNTLEVVFISFTKNATGIVDIQVRQPYEGARYLLTDEKADDNSVVHNTGDEDIYDTKSFYNVIKSKNSSYSGTYEGYYYQQSGGSLILGLRAGSAWLNYIQFGTDGNIQYSGTVNVSTPANGDNSTKVATTAFVNNYFTAITGYDATKTQTLKHDANGVLTWVDD